MDMKSYMGMTMMKKVLKHIMDMNPIAKEYDKNRTGNYQSCNLFEKSLFSQSFHTKKYSTYQLIPKVFLFLCHVFLIKE